MCLFFKQLREARDLLLFKSDRLLDKSAKGQSATTDSLGAVMEGAFEAAKKFMALIIEIFGAIKTYIQQ
jgi:hypothetical protein